MMPIGPIIAWRIGALAVLRFYLVADWLLGWEQPAWLTVPRLLR